MFIFDRLELEHFRGYTGIAVSSSVDGIAECHWTDFFSAPSTSQGTVVRVPARTISDVTRCCCYTSELIRVTQLQGAHPQSNLRELENISTLNARRKRGTNSGKIFFGQLLGKTLAFFFGQKSCKIWAFC